MIELGGGYNSADLSTYFTGLGVSAPSVTAVGVDGGVNTPGTDTNADGEVMLDIEIVGAVGPRCCDRRLLRAQHRRGLSRCAVDRGA